jgi:hypothetical protein
MECARSGAHETVDMSRSSTPIIAWQARRKSHDEVHTASSFFAGARTAQQGNQPSCAVSAGWLQTDESREKKTMAARPPLVLGQGKARGRRRLLSSSSGRSRTDSDTISPPKSHPIGLKSLLPFSPSLSPLLVFAQRQLPCSLRSLACNLMRPCRTEGALPSLSRARSSYGFE